MKLVWLSDIHLEFLSLQQAEAFAHDVASKLPSAVLITGDTSTANRLESHFDLLTEHLDCPIYFIEGNHDFYGGSFRQVGQTVEQLCRRHGNLVELGHGEIVSLSDNSSLIGTRGWADGRAGEGPRSSILLNDFNLIDDLRGLGNADLYSLLNRLGDDSAEYITRTAKLAFEQGAEKLFVATHVPPFREASLYEGGMSHPSYAPHFVNVALGEALLHLASANPAKDIVVLSGHTHHAATYSAAPNLIVRVAGAEYGRPAIADIIHFV